MMRNISLPTIAGVLSILFLLAGCGEQFVLKHSPITAAASEKGTVSLVVNNKRPADKGGNDELYIGQVRNSYGIPFKKAAGNSVVVALKSLFTDALAAAGYKVSDGAPTQVVVDINSFFMDGYMGYKIDADCPIQVVSGGSATYTSELKENTGFAYWSDNSIYDAYDKMMNQIAQHAVTIFNSPEFQAAVK